MSIDDPVAGVSVTGIDLVRVQYGRIVVHRGLTATVGLIRQLAPQSGGMRM